MKRVPFALAVTLLALSTIAIHTHAQTAPLPYGMVQNQGTFDPANCTGGAWVPGLTCAHATMHCDASLNVADLGFTFGYETPASGVNNGTVVAFAGGNGTSPATSIGNEVQALQAYLNGNLEIVQVKWDSAWEATQDPIPPDWFGNIQYAACRPAGLLHFVFTSPALFHQGQGIPRGGMCAHGFSAGSAAIAYSLSWYGAGWGSTGYLDNVELLSGPVLSEVDTGCEIPQQLALVNVCSGPPGCRMQSTVQPWNQSPEYVDGDENMVRAWSNIQACAGSPQSNTGPWNSVWNNMSILSSSITPQQLTYSNTSMKAWLCGSVYNNGELMNNSSSQGWFFYQQANWDLTTSVVNAVTKCQGPEGVFGSNATAYDGVAGNVGVLITTDMIGNCHSHHGN